MRPARASTRRRSDKRVPRGRRVRVVVEIGVDVAPCGPLVRQPPRPAVQRCCAVAAGVVAGRAMEPHVDQGTHVRLVDFRRPLVVQTQRDLMFPQQGEGVRHIPGRIPKLQHVLQPRASPAAASRQASRQGLQKPFEAGPVELLEAGQLIQHRAEAGSECGRAIEQAFERRLRIAQPFQVREIPAGLDRHHEAWRRLLRPGRKRLGFRQTIEGRVRFDRVETPRVVRQPVRRRKGVGIEAPAPRLVIPARAADAELGSSFSGPVDHVVRCPFLSGAVPPAYRAALRRSSVSCPNSCRACRGVVVRPQHRRGMPRRHDCGRPRAREHAAARLRDAKGRAQQRARGRSPQADDDVSCDAGGLEGPRQDIARRPHERQALPILLIAGLLADQHECGGRGALAEHCLRCVSIERASAAGRRRRAAS